MQGDYVCFSRATSRGKHARIEPCLFPATTIRITMDGRFQDFQRFPDSNLVLQTVARRLYPSIFFADWNII